MHANKLSDWALRIKRRRLEAASCLAQLQQPHWQLGSGHPLFGVVVGVVVVVVVFVGGGGGAIVVS